MVKHRAFNKSYIINDSFIKLSQEDRLNDEINYYHRIQHHDQKHLFAEFRGDKSNGLVYALELKNYENYKNIAEYFFNSDSHQHNSNLMRQLMWMVDLLHTYPKSDIPQEFNGNVNDLNYKMLVEKTVNEYNAFLKSSNLFNELCSFDSLEINGVSYKNFSIISGEIFRIISDKYLKFDLNIIHGDCCFANIMVNPSGSSLIFVDPRGSYGMKGIFGDKCYDYGKMLHSVSGNYEQIIYDMFDLTYESNRISFTFDKDLSYLRDVISKNINKATLEKSELIQGLIFIGMCARHYDSVDRQIIMYCTGVKILNEWLDAHK